VLDVISCGADVDDLPERAVPDRELAHRMKVATESILENERLTADLDDAAARVLLDWGIACAESVARRTAHLDDTEVEAAMSCQLRAIRRLMRTVNKWFGDRETADVTRDAALLDRVLEQATAIYGPRLVKPSFDRRKAFLRHSAGTDCTPACAVSKLRALVEGSEWGTDSSPGGTCERKTQ
jgi:hypothetical protein